MVVQTAKMRGIKSRNGSKEKHRKFILPMTVMTSKLIEFAGGLGISVCVEFDPAWLEPEERVRALCYENKCGCYNNNYMCPPYIGTLEESKARLKGFGRGLLFQYSAGIDVRNDLPGVMKSKQDFQEKILKLEEVIRRENIESFWGMMGGSCGLCLPCKASTEEPCPYPEKARTSLESIGIDVLAFLERIGLDNRFLPDKITWTGCILYSE